MSRLSNLRLLLFYFPISNIEDHISNIPHKIAFSNLHFWDGYDENWSSSLVYFHDEKLRKILEIFIKLGAQLLKFAHSYKIANNDYVVFSPHPRHAEADDEIRTIQKAATSLRRAALARLTKLVHSDYLEIDLNQETIGALSHFRKTEAESKKRLRQFLCE